MKKQLTKTKNECSSDYKDTIKNEVRYRSRNRVPSWSRIIDRYKSLVDKKLVAKSFGIHSITGLGMIFGLYVFSNSILPLSPFLICMYVLIQSRLNNMNKFESFHFGLISSLFFCICLGLITHLTGFNILIMIVYIFSITMLSVVYNDIGNY